MSLNIPTMSKYRWFYLTKTLFSWGVLRQENEFDKSPLNLQWF